ncbi:hypothetical protein CYMTET_23576 [Cymbomonas tetramitiformis]|uniref:RING-type domain-containing protein n=1 Tax=Cymbomonas tetramitiformis TaxID=36881 RepID=A0AAE0FXW6_9CHLO|nr:hypothetical protein CYMTET_23576 [Cymbomonas tetramitiformis]
MAEGERLVEESAMRLTLTSHLDHVPVVADPDAEDDAPIVLLTADPDAEEVQEARPSTSHAPASGSASMADEESMTCMICHEIWSVSGPHRVTSLKCGHLFGKSCILTWLDQKPKCPSCNSRCKARDLRDIYATKVVAADTEEVDAMRGKIDQLEASLELVRAKSELSGQQLKRQRTEYESLSASHTDLQSRLASLSAASPPATNPTAHTPNRIKKFATACVPESRCFDLAAASRMAVLCGAMDGAGAGELGASTQSAAAASALYKMDLTTCTTGEAMPLHPGLGISPKGCGSRGDLTEIPGSGAGVSRMPGSRGWDHGCGSRGWDLTEDAGSRGLGSSEMPGHGSWDLTRMRDCKDHKGFSGAASPLCPPHLALFSVQDGALVENFPLPAPAWAAAWGFAEHFEVYAGLANGSVHVFDIRRQGVLRTHECSQRGPPVHTVVPVGEAINGGGVIAATSREVKQFRAAGGESILLGGEGPCCAFTVCRPHGLAAGTYRATPGDPQAQAHHTILRHIPVGWAPGVRSAAPQSTLMPRTQLLVLRPDVQLLACPDECSRSLWLWDTVNGNLVDKLPGHSHKITDVRSNSECLRDPNDLILLSLGLNSVNFYQWHNSGIWYLGQLGPANSGTWRTGLEI